MSFSILNSQYYLRFVRWAFARFYHEFAWTYDLVAALVSAGGWRSWALTSVRYARGATLELGCGTGYVQAELARRHAAPVVGLDQSPHMLRLTRRRLAGADLNPALVRADARSLPFASASFDTIIATFPSEYIVSAATVAEIQRVLRPGGHVAVALWARFHGDSAYARLIDLAYRLTLQRSPRPDSTPAPATQTRLGEALERAGLRVIHEEAIAGGGVVQYVVGRMDSGS